MMTRAKTTFTIRGLKKLEKEIESQIVRISQIETRKEKNGETLGNLVVKNDAYHSRNQTYRSGAAVA